METTQVEPRKYIVLQETSPDKIESWMYFILYNGNEETVKRLTEAIQNVDWDDNPEDLNYFDIDPDYLVSEQTATDMISVRLNYTTRHRKFDGKLSQIDFGINDKTKNSSCIRRINRTIGNGMIGKFVTNEVFADNKHSSEDEESGTETSEDSESSSRSRSNSRSSSSSSTSSSSEEERKEKKKHVPLPKKKTVTEEPSHFIKVQQAKRGRR